MSKRKLPLWITEQRKSNSLLESKLGEEKCVTVASPPVSDTIALCQPLADLPSGDEPPKRRLRNNYTLAPEVTKPDIKIEYLPFVEYNGIIEYYTSMHDIAFSCDNILQWVHKQPPDDHGIPIAFDMEWPFNFQTGPGRTALMQLCPSTDRCLLFQLSCLKRLPAALMQLLYHPRVILHGVNIKNDFRKLARDFPGVDAERLISQCCDLGQWYNKLQGTTGIWSMERLVHSQLKLRINKDKRVRMSKWDVLPLSDYQKLYAAIDVYVSQELYLKLVEKERVQLEADTQCEPQLITTPTATPESPPAERAVVNLVHRTNNKQMTRLVHVLHAGRLDYRRALQLQRAVASLVHQASSLPDAEQQRSSCRNVLITTEHDPVYTIGIRTHGYDAAAECHLKALGADFVRTNRGGLITFHGPGQLVAYPILNLKLFQPSVRWYVCHLERSIIELCRRYGLRVQTTTDTGVWVGDRKICAIGIHASRYVTTHGLALNCSTELGWFRHIVPCGLARKSVTSLAAELNRPELTVDTVMPEFLSSFSDTLECDLIPMDDAQRQQLLSE
uniref:3'-5' exonuclease n=1 Tax=Anopheles atroparvus TaxID=41427 RepID=A0AAG5DMU0_ANOAO